MLRVKVKIPEVDVPYFESVIKEEDYNKFKDFLDELDKRFGEGNVDCTASVVKPEATDDEDEETDPIAEHIKDHPMLMTNSDKELKDFFDKLDKCTIVESKEEPELDPEVEEDSPEDLDDSISATVKIKKYILTDIYYRDKPEIKRNAVDGSYPVFDIVKDEIEVRIPNSVMSHCTKYNVAKFIQQQVIFTLMDPEYCEIDDDNLDEVFNKDNFDDSYCYDTGIYSIEFYNIYFSDTSISQEDCDSINGYLGCYDYREMEDIYTKLRRFGTEE